MTLQDCIFDYLKGEKIIPLPRLAFHFTDLHGADGGIDKHVDPLKASGKEAAVVSMLDHFLGLGYAWLASEIWDAWRGYLLEAICAAHPELKRLVSEYVKAGRLYWTQGNHEMDLLIRPEVQMFEGFGRTVVHYHGAIKDAVNWDEWWAGRLIVRMADRLGIDPESSPHPSNIDRHAAVRGMIQELADNNPGWDVFVGHTHWPENPLRYKVFKIDDKDRKRFFVHAEEFDEKTMEKISELQNVHNPGSPTTGVINYTLIEEGKITPRLWA
jgi:hypothetical protein